MSNTTGIEWTDATWNPVTGCTEVSPGCDHCYAKTFAERFRGTEGHYFEQGFDVQLRPDKLDWPLRKRKPQRIFVNSMSDLFHDSVPDDYIAQVFATMAWASQHTFQVLTKRHGRMRTVLNNDTFRSLVDDEYFRIGSRSGDFTPYGNKRPLSNFTDYGWPLPNVWLGVSAEDAKWAKVRGDALRATPAAVRFFSCEPLLGPMDGIDLDGIGWVIVGGESGHGARPMHPDWARSLRDQCVAAGVPFLFKQWGEHAPEELPIGLDGAILTGMRRVGKKAAGRILDGRTWDEYPAAAS